MRKLERIIAVVLVIFISMAAGLLSLNYAQNKELEEKAQEEALAQETTPAPTPEPTPTPKPEPTPPPAPKPPSCIIMINGVKYDVINLQKTHEGGNVFVCGKDNTAIYYSEHDTKFLSKMIPYKVN